MKKDVFIIQLTITVRRKAYPNNADSSFAWLLTHSSKTPSPHKTVKFYRLTTVFIAELVLCPSAAILRQVCCLSGSLIFTKFHQQQIWFKLANCLESHCGGGPSSCMVNHMCGRSNRIL